MPETITVEFDGNNRADIEPDDKRVYLMNRGKIRGWKIITSLSALEMDELCKAWSAFKAAQSNKHKATGGVGDATGRSPG